jgi:hypothetical protein
MIPSPDPDDPEQLILQPRPAPAQHLDMDEIKLPPRKGRLLHSDQYIDDEGEDAAS